MSDPYRESTRPVFRRPWYQRHRRAIFRGIAFATWATVDGLLWYWAYLFAHAHGGDYAFVAMLTIIHMVAAVIGSIVLYRLADREP